MKQRSLSTDREPGAWIEAFPIGNGFMGAWCSVARKRIGLR